MDVLLIGNDQTIKVLGLQDEISGDYLNTAAVTAHLKNKDGTDVDGENWPVDLQYVEDSNGNYIGNLDDAIDLKPCKTYFVEIRADAGGGLKALWRFPRFAQYRQP